MAIPYLDLAVQYKKIQSKIEPKVLEILASGQYVLGPEVVACEKELSQFTGATFSSAVSNGTVALLNALLAVGVGPGDEVITTGFSFFATAEVITLIGAHPIFVDIEADTYNINVALIEKAVTSKTKAIMPVSLYGQIADMDEINAIAKKHGLYVIEDAAQSFGAIYKGKRSCSISHIGCTSFFPAKPLGCAGDGGAVFTSDSEIAKKLDYIRVHGQTRRYHHEYIGFNGRLDPIQCAVIREKLKFYDEDLNKRREIAQAYNDAFAGLKGAAIPVVRADRNSVFAQYTLAVPQREEFIKKLDQMGVPTSIHYPSGMHEQPVYKNLKFSLPVTEKLAKQVVSLPLYPDMPQENVKTVIQAVQKALS
jgi:UDP-2-acetamido-2-deoxy-ribo-hexuluronate aminotransferase